MVLAVTASLETVKIYRRPVSQIGWAFKEVSSLNVKEVEITLKVTTWVRTNTELEKCLSFT